jgi:hypothetical protein
MIADSVHVSANRAAPPGLQQYPKKRRQYNTKAVIMQAVVTLLHRQVQGMGYKHFDTFMFLAVQLTPEQVRLAASITASATCGHSA